MRGRKHWRYTFGSIFLFLQAGCQACSSSRLNPPCSSHSSVQIHAICSLLTAALPWDPAWPQHSLSSIWTSALCDTLPSFTNYPLLKAFGGAGGDSLAHGHAGQCNMGYRSLGANLICVVRQHISSHAEPGPGLSAPQLSWELCPTYICKHSLGEGMLINASPLGLEESFLPEKD